MSVVRWFRNPWTRGVLVLILLASAFGAIWWRGPDWGTVWHAFDVVSWRWVVLAVAINLLSIVARSISWRLTIGQAVPEPHPSFGKVFSAFCVGLLGNAVLPARAGEFARVAVLRRHMPEHGRGTSATLVGTVFAHRLFDLPAVALLVVYVLLTAKIPGWAVTSLELFGLVALALLAVAMLSARRRDQAPVCSSAARKRATSSHTSPMPIASSAEIARTGTCHSGKGGRSSRNAFA